MPGRWISQHVLNRIGPGNPRSLFALHLFAFASLFLFSCGDDSVAPADEDGNGGDGEEAPAISIASSLSGPGGGEAVAGDTVVYRVTVSNTGNASAYDLTIDYDAPDRFDLYSEGWDTARKSNNPVQAGEAAFDLGAGESADYTILLGSPGFFPNGWSPELAARLHFDDDGSDSTAADSLDVPAPFDSIRNDGMHFELLAPGVPSVYLTGEFNSWGSASGDYKLFSRGDDENRAITIPVSGRQQYKFQLVDPSSGAIEWIGDPRATRLEPDGFNGYNSVAGIDLPDPVSPLAGGIDPTRLVIYELFTWDFSAAADFEAIEDAITGGVQNLADLGVNAIELLPVTGIFPSDFNWGYNPRFYFAVEDDYGSPENFASLVQTAHNNGMAVILDMVFNHMGQGGPLQKIDEMGRGGVFINHDQEDVFGMKQINWYSEETRRFLLECTLFWIEQYGIDGFRMDLVDWRDYSGYAWWREEVRERHPEFFVIGEDFSYPAFGNSVTNAGCDAQWGGQHTDGWGGNSNNFQQTVMALLEEDTYDGRLGTGLGSFNAADNPMWALANVMEWTAGYPSVYNEVKYIVSHDERRLSYEVEQAGSAEAAAIGGAQKGKLGAVTLLTATGIPMIYMGEEIGADNYVPPHPTPNKIDWSSGDAGLRTVYKNMIHLRLNHPTLAEGGTAFFGSDWPTSGGRSQQEKTIACWRYGGSNQGSTDIVVAFNFDHAEHGLSIPFPAVGTWYLWDPETNGVTEVTVAAGGGERLIPASTAFIYLKDTAYLP